MSSKRLILAVLAGFVLASAADSGWAAARKGVSHAAAGKRSAKVRPAKSTKHPLPAVETGTAEIMAGDAAGIHGRASFYGSRFEGRRTATGDRFDSRALTGASNHFPLGSWVAVRRLDDNRCVAVRINDRMGDSRRRIIDLSRGAAQELGMISAGVVLVRVAPLGRKRDAEACRAAFSPANLGCPDCEDRAAADESLPLPGQGVSQP